MFNQLLNNRIFWSDPYISYIYIINKRILGNVDKAVQSETFKALESDIKLFGTDLAFSKN